MFANLKRLGRVEDDLCQLRRHVDDLKADQKRLELEANELYEKTLRLLQRNAKRYARDLKDLEEPQVIDSANSNSSGLDPISEQILARRNKGYLAQ